MSKNTTLEQVEGLTIVSLRMKYLDAQNAKTIKAELQSLLEPEMKVILDVSDVEILDSSGLGVVISCLRQLSSSGGDLKLAGVSKKLRTIFELVRFHHVLDLFSSREEAIRAYNL
jgi:anti-sigma B factor antagonist